MDLDSARDAWQHTGESENPRSASDILRDAQCARVPGALAPLARGQFIALLLGFGTTTLGAAYLRKVSPMSWQSVIALALVMHGIATMIFAVRLRIGVASLDVSAPTLTLYRAVTVLRRWFVIGGLSVGLSWLFIWPLVIAAALGVWTAADLVETAPTFLVFAVAGGGAAHVLTLAILWWRSTGPLGSARIEHWFSARGLEESLRLLEPMN